MPEIFRSLHYKNFRLYFIGQGISVLGGWTQSVAMSWLVYKLTNSAMLLGTIAFISSAPSLIVTPIAGHLADKLNKKQLLVFTQISAMIVATILAILTMSGTIQVWHLILLSFFQGLVMAFDMPIRQSFVYDLIDDKKDLPNAVSLNSFMFNSARLIGPSIGGIIISVLNEGFCFGINALSYLGVLIALMKIKTFHKTNHHNKTTAIDGIIEGFKYSYKHKAIFSILILVSIMTFFGLSYNVLMPIYAKDILQGGPHTLGFLMSAVGVGALIGAAFVASKKSAKGLEYVLGFSSLITGVAVFFFAESSWLPASLFSMFLAGLGLSAHFNSANSLIQTRCDHNVRGRVMALYSLCFLGVSPFASLTIGFFANHLGAQTAGAISGFLCAVYSIYFISRIKTSKHFEAKHD